MTNCDEAVNACAPLGCVLNAHIQEETKDGQGT